MKPARSGRNVPNTLDNCEDSVIVVMCACGGGRRGEYRKETLLSVFNWSIEMPSLLAHIAAWRGCALAKPHPTKLDLASFRECRIHYDVED
jgi:hypothetical protein